MSEQAEDKTDADDGATVPASPRPEGSAEGAPRADESTAEAAPPPKTSVQPSDDEEGALDAAGRERPRFLLQFPDDPDLARLAAAFEAGNYKLVRAEAETLAERTQSPAVRDAALELRRRIAPDPLVKYLLAITGALLLFLTWFTYGH